MTATTSLFVGLDCGGSTCRALAIDGAGVVRFRGQSGAANLATTPLATLRANLRKACAGCPPPAAACGCFAGLLTSADRSRAERLLGDIFPAARLRVEPDYAAALCADDPRPDLCVVAGTGSLVCSFSGGQVVRSGARGYLLGDEGSAFAFGRDALNAFLDGESSEPLRAAAREVLGAGAPDEAIRAAYASRAPAALLARLAPALGRDAEADRPYARASLAKNFGALAEIARAHVAAYGPAGAVLRVALAGGLWRAAPVFREEFSRMLTTAMAPTRLTLGPLRRPPARGAVSLAMELMLGN